MGSVPKLPAELIREVFDWAAAIDPPRRRAEGEDIAEDRYPKDTLSRLEVTLGWILITHVCFGWRTIGLSMTHLWASVVDTFLYPDISDELLLRAKGRGLTLRLTDCPPGHTRHMSNQINFNWSMQRLHHASTLIVPGLHHLNHTQGSELRGVLTSHRFPCLQHLTVGPLPPPSVENTAEDGETSAQPGEEILLPFRLYALQLTTAVLGNVMCLPTSSLPQLRSLVLHFDDTIRNICFVRLVCCLYATPRLEEFVLITNSELDFALVPNNYQPLVCLNRLRSLVVICRRSNNPFHVWGRIAAPNIVSIDIDCDWAQTLQSLPSNQVQRLLSRTHFTKIRLDPSQLALFTPQDVDDALPFTETFIANNLQLDIPGYVQILDGLCTHAKATIARVSHVELSFPDRSLSLERSILDQKLDDRLIHAIERLGQVLISTVSLELLVGRRGQYCLAFLYLLARQATQFIPALQTLRLVVSYGPKAGLGAREARLWWEAVKDVMERRKRAGIPLRQLVVSGTWCTSHEWTQAWAREVARCVADGLIEGFLDERTLQSSCERCKPQSPASAPASLLPVYDDSPLL